MKFLKGLWLRFTIFRMVMRDKRTPFWSKLFVAVALAYLLAPFDMISDFIPFLGQFDDAAIIITLITLALKLIPSKIKEKYRELVTKQQK